LKEPSGYRRARFYRQSVLVSRATDLQLFLGQIQRTLFSRTTTVKTILFDSLNEEGARKFTGCKIVDESGEPVGALAGLWMDSTSHQVEFLGIKSRLFSGKVHLIPARDVQIIEGESLIRLRYPAALVKKAPSFSPGAELAQVEKEEEINKHGGRAKAPPRINSIEAIRPEEALGAPDQSERSTISRRTPQAPETREDLERKEQLLFNQNGFVTDSMPEVDASQELLRVQKEAKARNREDRIKDGHLD
jgi:PRC-barrel domain